MSNKLFEYKIAVMGAAGRRIKLPKELLGKAREVGKEIARNNCVLITGACMGVAQEAAVGATKEKGLIIGFSPANNLKEHTEPPISYPKPTINTILIFTGLGKEGRNILSVRTCDAVIFLSGRVGTLNEFSIAYQLGRVIGILRRTGGITDKISEITKWCEKNTGATLIYDYKPKTLVKKIISLLKEKDSIYGKTNRS